MNIKKIFTILTIAICLFFVASCEDNYNQKVDKNKTQLYVAIQDGGYGSTWLSNAAKRFEEKYKDVSFEEGKTGVQIIIDCNSKYKGSNLTNILKTPDLEYEVFFTEGVNYTDLYENDYLLDITDVVTSDLTHSFISSEVQTEYSGEGTIESKIIADDLTNYLKTSDNKYYALPYFDAYYGIIYDVDLFNENNLWFAADGCGDKLGFVKSETTKKSNGPDGVYGTYDDGLPATYDDFFRLCDHMVEIGIVPFTWGGKVQEYLSYFMQQLCVNYEGLENAKTDYYFGGTITTYVSGFDQDGLPIEETKTISREESYLLNTKRAGKFYACQFMERLLHNSSYYDLLNCTSPSVTHIDAKKNFLYPRFIKTANSSEVAMIIDGTWWQNEAAGAFETLETLYPGQASASVRKFGIMPLPKANASKIGEPFVISNGGSSYGFIKSNIDSSKVNLAKQFLQFIHTNNELCEFTKATSATRPYNYTFSDEDYESLTYFGKQAYSVHTSADYLIPYSNNEDFKRNSSKVGYMWQTKVNGSQYGLPSYALINNPTMTAKDLFNGLSNMYTPEYWNNNLLNK